MGGVRALRLLVMEMALFCLGISLSFVVSPTAATTEVCCAAAGNALGDADGEALVRLDEHPTSGPLPTPEVEAWEKEEDPVRASLLSMLVLAASPFFTSGLVLLARNCSLKGVVSHPLGVLLGSSAAGRGGASLLGVFLL